MGWTYGTCGGKISVRFRWGNLKERDHLEDIDIDGRVTLKRILKIGWEGEDCINSDPRWGQVAGCCERGDEPSVCINCGECKRYVVLTVRLVTADICFTVPTYAQYLTIVSIYPYTCFGLLIAILRGSQPPDGADRRNT